MLAEVKRLEAAAQEAGKEREAAEQALRSASQVQFTCFTSTKVQILTRRRRVAGTQFTCFTSTKVQLLTRRRCGKGERGG